MKNRPSCPERKLCRTPSYRITTPSPSKPRIEGTSPLRRGPPPNERPGTDSKISEMDDAIKSSISSLLTTLTAAGTEKASTGFFVALTVISVSSAAASATAAGLIAKAATAVRDTIEEEDRSFINERVRANMIFPSVIMLLILIISYITCAFNKYTVILQVIIIIKKGEHMMSGQQPAFIAKSLIVCAALLLTACSTVKDNTDTAVVSGSADNKNADRQAILAMAGNYRVRFDFRETVAFQKDYDLKKRYQSGAYEVVRVIADEPDFISLQHILVIGDGEEIPLMPIKHWRQDWHYEPDQILSYIGANVWENTQVANSERSGAWSQTVYQVDDSPRYSAVARWHHENGVSSWTSPPSNRPLPRRDATKRDDYHVIVARNRHAITPEGWVHEQDNAKVILSGKTPQTLAHEIGVNTYYRYDDFNVHIATDYWEKTKDFWAGVRDVWQNLAENNPQIGLTMLGEASDLYMQIFGLASEVEEGQKQVQTAASEAQKIIEEFVTFTPESVQKRLTEQQGHTAS